jgi:hypothetical protein
MYMYSRDRPRNHRNGRCYLSSNVCTRICWCSSNARLTQVYRFRDVFAEDQLPRLDVEPKEIRFVKLYTES